MRKGSLREVLLKGGVDTHLVNAFVLSKQSAHFQMSTCVKVEKWPIPQYLFLTPEFVNSRLL